MGPTVRRRRRKSCLVIGVDTTDFQLSRIHFTDCPIAWDAPRTMSTSRKRSTRRKHIITRRRSWNRWSGLVRY
jgi:hypothetical protein